MYVCEIGTLSDLEKLTPGEFFGFIQHHQEKKLIEFRDRWDQTRLIAYMVRVSGFVQGKDKPRSIESFMPLPWDSEQKLSKAPAMTKDEVREMFERVKRRDSKLAARGYKLSA